MNRLNRRLANTLTASFDELMKDREALAVRNKTLADAIHQKPLRHRIRRLLLNFLATTYIPPSRTADQTDRILLIRPDHLGDVLLTTPAIQAIREAYPNTEIHALVGPWSAGVLENVDLLDLVLTVQFPGFTRGKNKNWRSPYRYAIQTARRLRRIGYRRAVIFRPDHWWGAWLARMTGIPERIGYNNPDTELFLTHVIEHQHEHATKQSLRLASALIGADIVDQDAAYKLPINAIDEAFVSGYLGEWGLDPQTELFCIHPGSGSPIKQWDTEKWAQTADILTEQLDAQVVFTGSDSELAMIREINSQMNQNATIMAGDTTVGQLAALYARAQVVLGPDSGPLHVAAAVGTPSVTLFGPADPVEFGPWGDTQKHVILTTDIACRPCRVLDWRHDDAKYHPCVREIGVSQVLHAARLAASTQP
ncbi:MAG: glycosyltransferase family 9 protein [Chloroflexota bacterium]